MIAYDDATHTYTLLATGERLLSVTQILTLAGLKPDYTGIPPHVLQRAAERGQYVDRCVALGDDLDVESVHPEALGYVLAWRKFCETEGYAPLEEQTIVWHPELKYAGTVDSIGAVGDDCVFVERKCTSKLDPSYAIQTAGYAMYGIRPAGSTQPYGHVRRWVVQLKPDGNYVPMKCDTPGDFGVFSAALQIAQWKTAQNGRLR